MTRLVYGNFIRVWREKEASVHESRIKRLLLLNASHESTSKLMLRVFFREVLLTYVSKNSFECGCELP
jgi:hypothetical protein